MERLLETGLWRTSHIHGMQRDEHFGRLDGRRVEINHGREVRWTEPTILRNSGSRRCSSGYSACSGSSAVSHWIAASRSGPARPGGPPNALRTRRRLRNATRRFHIRPCRPRSPSGMPNSLRSVDCGLAPIVDASTPVRSGKHCSLQARLAEPPLRREAGPKKSRDVTSATGRPPAWM